MRAINVYYYYIIIIIIITGSCCLSIYFLNRILQLSHLVHISPRRISPVFKKRSLLHATAWMLKLQFPFLLSQTSHTKVRQLTQLKLATVSFSLQFLVLIRFQS